MVMFPVASVRVLVCLSVPGADPGILERRSPEPSAVGASAGEGSEASTPQKKFRKN